MQRFDRLAYSYKIDRDSSFAVDLRRVSGMPPQPNGDPNTLVTVPQAIFKLIFYVGSQKGT